MREKQMMVVRAKEFLIVATMGKLVKQAFKNYEMEKKAIEFAEFQKCCVARIVRRFRLTQRRKGCTREDRYRNQIKKFESFLFTVIVLLLWVASFTKIITKQRQETFYCNS